LIVQDFNQSSQSGQTARFRQRRPGLRVFLVENHDDTRLLLSLLLEHMGHTVLSAATMREALHKIPESRCDVLISDIGLPDGDGWELMRRLDGRGPRFAIAMSGRGLADDTARSHAAGFRHHLVKPTGTEHIADLLERAARELKREHETV
jgi:CheY-like chemotaxis protein